MPMNVVIIQKAIVDGGIPNVFIIICDEQFFAPIFEFKCLRTAGSKAR